MQTVLRKLTLTLSILVVLLSVAPAAPAVAAFDIFGGNNGACTNPDVSNKVSGTPICNTDGKDPITGKNGIIYKVARILAFAAGVAAVIMIMVGGFMFVTAGGDSGRAKTGRSMVVGAVVGLAIIALASAIVALAVNIVD